MTHNAERSHMRCVEMYVLVILASACALAQPKVTKIEKLSLGSSQVWGSPRFSPDGKSVYFTTENYDGIWEYSLGTKTSQQITGDRGAGFGFRIGQDGNSIAYRRTQVDPTTHLRTGEVVLVDRHKGAAAVLGAGRDISLPSFAGTSVVFSSTEGIVHQPSGVLSGPIAVLGIEKTKIAVYRDGQKILLDPLKGGSYIWPSLSPDGQWILAYDMDRGTFICSTYGTVRSMLGRKDSPAWTRDGRWVIFSDEKDDGYRIISSHLGWISVDGGTGGLLTEADSLVALTPSCSPVENKIVFSTISGGVYVIDYEEEGQ